MPPVHHKSFSIDGRFTDNTHYLWNYIWNCSDEKLNGINRIIPHTTKYIVRSVSASMQWFLMLAFLVFCAETGKHSSPKGSYCTIFSPYYLEDGSTGNLLRYQSAIRVSFSGNMWVCISPSGDGKMNVSKRTWLYSIL